MNFLSGSLNQLWSEIIIEELCRQGVKNFIISAGSRSSPLTLACANNKAVTAKVHYDERGAGFYALGLAKATGTASALICTSGTAVANYLPVVVEAFQDNVPLILLTADRPVELHYIGANQTIDQLGIFGKFVNKEFNLPCPELNFKPELLLSTIGQVCEYTMRATKGPVHLNCPFREPLSPPDRLTSFDNYCKAIEKWKTSGLPFTNNKDVTESVSEEAIKNIAGSIMKISTGLLILGRNNNLENKNIVALAKKLNWPTIIDISSQLRFSDPGKNKIEQHDLFLLDKKNLLKICGNNNGLPFILHLGGVPVSKRLLDTLKQTECRQYLMVNDSTRITDPTGKVSKRIVANPDKFAKMLLDKMNIYQTARQNKSIQEINSTTRKILIKEIDNKDNLSEPMVARIISTNIKNNSALFLSSSMPIRDMDIFAGPQKKNIAIGSNRGASGIDGIIASASGFAQGLKRQLTLIIGDLAFLHDLNSLSLVKQSTQPITIVIINNNGGGIFSFLPVRKREKQFEKYFGTPHNLSFEKSAEMFSLSYCSPTKAAEFKKIYIKSQQSRKSSIIEIKTNRDENILLHKELYDKVRDEIKLVLDLS